MERKTIVGVLTEHSIKMFIASRWRKDFHLTVTTNTSKDRIWVSYLPTSLQKRFKHRHVFQEAVENSWWLVTDRILRMGVGLIVGVWVARYLGPSQYGLLSYAGAVVALASAVAALGIDSVVLRDLVKFPENTNELLGTTFVMRFLSGAVCYAILVFAVIAIRPGDHLSHIIVAIFGWSLTLNAFDVIDIWFQSKVLSKYVVFARNFAFIVSAVVRIFLIVTKATVVAFAVVNLLELVIGFVGLVLVYSWKNQSIRKWNPRLHLAKGLFINGWPILLGSVISMVTLRIDQVILGQIGDPKELGVYAAAVRIAEIWFFIPSAIIGSVFPNIIRVKEIDEAEFYKRLQKLYNVLVFLGYAVAVPITIFNTLIIKTMYGEPYAAAAPMLVLLIWSNVFMNISIARGAYLFTMNWTWILFWTNTVGAISNIILNFLLIPKYGGVGAAIASCISYWIAAHGTCYIFKQLRPSAAMINRALICPRFW